MEERTRYVRKLNDLNATTHVALGFREKLAVLEDLRCDQLFTYK